MNLITRYIRDGKRRKIGVMTALIQNGVDHTQTPARLTQIGFSLCCKNDTFNRDHGIELAVGRGILNGEKDLDDVNVPNSIVGELKKFAAQLYSQNDATGYYPRWFAQLTAFEIDEARRRAHERHICQPRLTEH